MSVYKFSGLSSFLGRSLAVTRAIVPRRPIMSPAWGNTWTGGHTHVPETLGLPLCFAQSQRFYNRKKTKRIPPTKQPTFDYSGDMHYALPHVDKNSPKGGFENVEELKSADKTVQDIFSVNFADRKNIFAKQMKETLERIQEHPADLQSLEVMIATDTLRLRNQVQHMKLYRKDKVCKVKLIERIQRRNKLLRILRQRDMEKFEWLLEELRIKYIPLKPMEEMRKLSKRETREKNAEDAATKVKDDKIEKLRERIEEERRQFEKEKEEELSRIQKELSQLGIHEMESVESVVKQLGMEKHLEPKELRMKRRYIILGRKFQLWEENKNKEKVET